MPPFDAGITSLVEALEAKQLLDRVLVVATGEFGRTPSINKNAGRDHWPRTMWTLVAGGGAKRNYFLGGTDAKGMPFGLQVVGPFRGDLQVLSAAVSMEQAFATDPSLRRPRPDLAALRMPQPALDSIVTAPPPTNWREANDARANTSSSVV